MPEDRIQWQHEYDEDTTSITVHILASPVTEGPPDFGCGPTLCSPMMYDPRRWEDSKRPRRMCIYCQQAMINSRNK